MWSATLPATDSTPKSRFGEIIGDRLQQFFGFAQFDLAGSLSIADGRYLARLGGEHQTPSVLVIETLGAPRPSAKRRQRPRVTDADLALPSLPLTRATAVRASESFDQSEEATLWLNGAVEDDQICDALVKEGIDLLNRALHAHAVASADPHLDQLRPERAVAVRIGYGSGEQVAAGRFSSSRDVDVWATHASQRRRRADSLRPQERTAAILGGRDRIDICETMLLRARSDLDAGRSQEAALQLRIGLEALLVELPDALSDPGHKSDMLELHERFNLIEEVAETALREVPSDQAANAVGETLEICERVLRRRRLLRP